MVLMRQNKMRFRGWRAVGPGAVTALTLCASSAAAQSPNSPANPSHTVSVRAGPQYERGAFWRTLFGDEWREVWTAPITVPVLDLDAYAGGLTPFKAGGNQSKTLRMRGADGRTYVFRSTHKNVQKTLADDLQDTPLGAIAQDQAASLHPSCQLVVAVLQDAVGLLHTPPTLVVMPDDPRLGEYRKDFANALGEIEERPDDEGKGAPFAGANKINGTDKLLENLEESMDQKLDSREYLTARLLDFIVGDTDRGSDQWRFAQYKRDGRVVYRPIPRDRDYAFIRVEGLLMGIGKSVHPRLVDFKDQYPKLKSLVYMTQEFDRGQLVDLPWSAWDKVTSAMQRKLTDDVIERAVKQLPKAHYEKSGPEIAAALQARRNALPTIAREYYLLVNQDAEIFATDQAEHAVIDRHPDGSVSVQVFRTGGDAVVASYGARPPAFERRFVRDETREIRLHLERGNDAVLVRGSSDRSITVRVIGGEGDDVFADSSHVVHGAATHFYDASGSNTYFRGARTVVTTEPFVTPPPQREDGEEEESEDDTREISEERRGRFRDQAPESKDFLEEKFGSGPRDWGKGRDWTPMTGYRESGGVILGYGPTMTDYGFRYRPYAWRADLRAMVGTRNGGLGLQAQLDRRFENSPWSVSVFALATQLESNRFYGYGNDTELIDPALTLVERDEVLAHVLLRYSFNSTSMVSFGPVVEYVKPDVPSGSPAAVDAPLGSDPFGQIGARVDLTIDRTQVLPDQQSGFGVDVGASAYPAAWDAVESFGEAHALARLFIPMGWPTLALRAGGQHNWGEFPLHESAFIGGRWTLRGFRWNRFSGDASAFGAAELRVPLFRLTLLTRGQLGAVGFTDVGRVWMNDVSAGDWHTGVGGGLWFGSLGRQVSVTYAKGDEHRIYFYYGMPF